MIRILIIFFPFLLLAYPSLIELLTNYPPSHLRDFYLLQYLKKSNNLKESEKLYNEIKYKKKYHLKILAKKFNKYRKIYNCKYPNRWNFRSVDYKCIVKNGFNLSDLSKMKNEDIKFLLNKLPNSKVKTEIKAFYTKNYKLLYRNRNIFYDSIKYVIKDITIPDIYINNLISDKRFFYFLNVVVRKHNLHTLQKSLLNIDYNQVNDKSKFLLALNAVRFDYINYAVDILKSIKNKDNKVNFWLYLLTKNRKYAKKLLKNKRLDFYTLYIYEEFNKSYKLENVKIRNRAKVYYDIDNPLDVIKFYRDYYSTKNYKRFLKRLDNQKMLPFKVLVLDKINNYQKNYYILPKYNLNGLNLSEKVLFYAIARQESRFISAQISHSYAIGLMQLMPFLIRSFHPKESMMDFFKTKINVKYAKRHIKWLYQQLDNPLFVAYAYNGGIGFVKRKVIPYFKFKGSYEPFFSMEMVPYSESREYGKKVLTNYVIYYNKLSEEGITLHNLLGKE